MPRHARAVILLGGWLLMLPPAEKDASAIGGWKARDDAPVSSWRQLAAYDTARECERGKEALASADAAPRKRRSLPSIQAIRPKPATRWPRSIATR